METECEQERQTNRERKTQRTQEGIIKREREKPERASDEDGAREHAVENPFPTLARERAARRAARSADRAHARDRARSREKQLRPTALGVVLN